MSVGKDPRTADTDEFPGPGFQGARCQGPGGIEIAADYAALSHRGRVRPENEDHYLVARFGRFLEPVLSNLPLDQAPDPFQESGLALAVADGMGGARAGAVASALALRTLWQMLCDTPDWIFSDREGTEARVAERFAQRLREIDTAVREQSTGRDELAGMGTTMTLSASFGNRLLLAHVGDSRAYLLRGGRLHPLTRDHTLAQEMKDLGIVRSVEAAATRLRHTLTHALGGSRALQRTDVSLTRLADGDRLLLCSDGLHGMVRGDVIARLLGCATTADQACRTLVDAALEAGGRDNVTVIAVHYQLRIPDGWAASREGDVGLTTTP